MSKNHPKSSAKYNKKLLIRKEREPKRELLKAAKAVYLKFFSSENSINKSMLNKIKSIINE